MHWDPSTLWSKSKLYFDRALALPREDDQFGLWCALGLELLAKAAVASVSPTLLAEPHPEHQHLLAALGRGDARSVPRSVGANAVVDLCLRLFPPDFTQADAQTAKLLFGLRNEELHSGSAAFAKYTTQHWISGLYRCCLVLTKACGHDLTELLGKEEADVASAVLAEVREGVVSSVKSTVAAHAKVWSNKDPEDQKALAAKASEACEQLVRQRHHRVECPACKCDATVQGKPFGPATVEHDDEEWEVVVRQAVSPTSFSCDSCGLKLGTYAELVAAGLGSQYTRTTRSSPEEHYELINPQDDSAIQGLVQQYLDSHSPYDEYDNE